MRETERAATISILTTQIKDITNLLIDFTWERTPAKVGALLHERKRLMERRRRMIRKESA